MHAFHSAAWCSKYPYNTFNDYISTMCAHTRYVSSYSGSGGRLRRGGRHPYTGRSVGLVQFAYGLDLAFLFHAAVLEPDLNLALSERQLTRQLDASTARQIAVELEVLLELQSLEAGVRLSTSASLR